MSTFSSFLAVAAVAVLVPGPDTFVVLRTSLAQGARAGTWVAAGSAAGNVVWGAASVLGVQAIRGDSLAPADDRDRPQASAAAAFRKGVASDLRNVKVGLFWTALVPQFVSADSSALLAPAMALSMGSMVFAWLTAYAYGAACLTRVLRRRRSARAVNGTVGAVFMALGGRLAVASH